MSDLPSRRVAKAGDVARELGKLKDHEAWPVLRQRFEELQQADVQQLARKIIVSGTVDPAAVQARHGFWKGAEWVLNNPDLAEIALKQALRALERTQDSG